LSTQETNLKAIADAIREKDGTTEPIPAKNFPERIRAIQTGGTLPEDVRTITLTADPPEGGTVSGGGVAQDGMTVTIKAQPRNENLSARWEEDGTIVSTGNEYKFIVEGDRKLTAFFFNSRLPSGYVELQYIQSNGTQYIDTGIQSSANLKVVLDVSDVQTKSELSCLFGKIYFYFVSSTSNTSYYYDVCINDSGNIIARAGIPNVVILAKNEDGSRFTVTLDAKNGKASLNDESKSITVTQKYPMNIFLLCTNWLGNKAAQRVQSFADAKLHSCQMYNSDSIVRNFIPCISASGEIGLYDSVSEKFYGNAGTGAFIAGPVV